MDHFFVMRLVYFDVLESLDLRKLLALGWLQEILFHVPGECHKFDVLVEVSVEVVVSVETTEI